MRNCKWCGKEFDPGHYPKGGVRGTKLCPECQAKLVTPKPRTCKGCSKQFILAGKKRYRRVYCDECLEKQRIESANKQAQRQRYRQELEKGRELQEIAQIQVEDLNNKQTRLGDIYTALFEPQQLSLEKKRELIKLVSSLLSSLRMQTKEQARHEEKAWDNFVYNVLLQGEASEEEIKVLKHVVTSDNRTFGQCGSCHKYVEEKKIGEGFDPSLHLCYDWENGRQLCPECFSRQVSLTPII